MHRAITGEMFPEETETAGTLGENYSLRIEYKHSWIECRLKQTRNIHCSCMFTDLKSKGGLHKYGLNP